MTYDPNSGRPRRKNEELERDGIQSPGSGERQWIDSGLCYYEPRE